MRARVSAFGSVYGDSCSSDSVAVFFSCWMDYVSSTRKLQNGSFGFSKLTCWFSGGPTERRAVVVDKSLKGSTSSLLRFILLHCIHDRAAGPGTAARTEKARGGRRVCLVAKRRVDALPRALMDALGAPRNTEMGMARCMRAFV
jgi:hypothetical protein